jgi:hypothetical protein
MDPVRLKATADRIQSEHPGAHLVIRSDPGLGLLANMFEFSRPKMIIANPNKRRSGKRSWWQPGRWIIPRKLPKVAWSPQYRREVAQVIQQMAGWMRRRSVKDLADLAVALRKSRTTKLWRLHRSKCPVADRGVWTVVQKDTAFLFFKGVGSNSRRVCDFRVTYGWPVDDGKIQCDFRCGAPEFAPADKESHLLFYEDPHAALIRTRVEAAMAKARHRPKDPELAAIYRAAKTEGEARRKAEWLDYRSKPRMIGGAIVSVEERNEERRMLGLKVKNI